MKNKNRIFNRQSNAAQPKSGMSPTASHELIVEYRSPYELEADPHNSRMHSAKQIQQIARSIMSFGFVTPILIDAAGRVIAGHGRVAAARTLGLSSVPVIKLEHLTSTQVTAFAIADNKLAENAKWDKRLLAEQIKSLSEVELSFDMEVLGFESAEIDLLVHGLEPAQCAQADPADKLPGMSDILVTKEGDLWALGPHRLLCADALNDQSFLSLMDGQKAAAVFSDLPYDHLLGLGRIKHRECAMDCEELSETQFTNPLTRACSLLAQNSVNGSLHYLCGDWRRLSDLLSAGRVVYEELIALCVWNKGTSCVGSLYRTQHELVLVFKNGTEPHRGRSGHYRTDIWDYPGQTSSARNTKAADLLEAHPTPKPICLVADALVDCAARGDIVLDSFVGSGTTLLAAERVARVCYGLERDRVYVDATIRRWQSLTGLSATRLSSGRSFDELEREAENRHE